CTRCYSCAFHHDQVHTRPRVQRAPGVPHALRGGKIHSQLERIALREREVASEECEHAPHFRSSSPRMRGSSIPETPVIKPRGSRRTGSSGHRRAEATPTCGRRRRTESFFSV